MDLELKEKVSWLDSETFLLESSADIRQVYNFLKRNPGSAKFIYKKYKPLQPTIRERCDPENPIYLEEVANNLKNVCALSNAKEDITTLQNKKSYLQNDIDLLQKKSIIRVRNMVIWRKRFPKLSLSLINCKNRLQISQLMRHCNG